MKKIIILALFFASFNLFGQGYPKNNDWLDVGTNALTEYTEDSFVATNIASVYGASPVFNARTVYKRYKGVHDRLYIVFNELVGVRRASLIWYDFETKSFSPTSYPFGVAAPTGDTHNVFTIEISKDGKIMVGSCWDDGSLNLTTSVFPEFNNNGVIDVTYTTSAAAAALTTYGNYISTTYMNEKLILEWRGNAASGATQEDRCIVSSDDNGQTFNTKVDWLTFNNGYWAYGAMYPDKYKKGVFMTVSLQRNSNGSYPTWGIVWTNDLITFGNMEYYQTNGAGGWSKNVVSSGDITQAEFLSNIAIIDDGVTSNVQHYVPKMEQLINGDLIVHTCDGTKSGSNNITGYITSWYDESKNFWTHNTALISDFPIVMAATDAPIVNVALVPMDEKNIWMICKADDDTGNLLFTKNGGLSWHFEKEISPLSSSVSDGDYSSVDGDDFVLIQNGIVDVKVVRFGKHKFEEVFDENKVEAYGKMYIEGANETVIATGTGTFDWITDAGNTLWSDESEKNISVSGDAITIQISGQYEICYSLSYAAGNASVYRTAIDVSGTQSAKGRTYRGMSGTDAGVICNCLDIDLTTGQILKPVIEEVAGTTNATFYEGTFSAKLLH